MRDIIIVAGIILLCTQACISNQSTQAQLSGGMLVGGGCDGCEIMYAGMPTNLVFSDTTSGWWEEGDKLLVKGKVFQRDGKTPAAGVILYFWQTGADGLYRPSKLQQSPGRLHGRLRAWVQTDTSGQYALYTIRPAPYPDRNIPAHIHIAVLEPDLNEYYIDDVEFESDTLLTPELRASREQRAGSGIGILNMVGGTLHIRRDIILGKHIPYYK